MNKTAFEKISLGIEVTKEECARSLAAHMSNLKTLLERFENDNKLFAKAPDETLKAICQSSIVICQDKQSVIDEMTEKLVLKLDDDQENDTKVKIEAEEKKLEYAKRLFDAKLKFTNVLNKYNTDRVEEEKEQIENQEDQVKCGFSPIITTEVELVKLTLDTDINEFFCWVKKAEFYADAYLVHEKPRRIQQQMLLQHLDLGLSKMVTIMLTDGSDFKEGLERLKEIFDSIYPLYTRRWRHVKLKQKPEEDFLAWKARHYVSFCNAKMTEMSDEDHMVLSLLMGTREGRIKSKIASKNNPSMEEVEEIARSEGNTENIRRKQSRD